MRLIDADELIEHVWRDKLDSRELIAEMIENAPTVKKMPTKIPLDVFEQLLSIHVNEASVLDRIRAEIEQLPTNTRINWDGCCPDPDYPKIEFVDVSKNRLLSIIDKYKSKSRSEE